MTGIVKNHEKGVTKSAGGSIGAREARAAHRRSFGNLIDTVKEAAGLPGDQVPYWDPMGFLNSRGEAINMKSRMHQKWQPVFTEFNELAADGHSVYDSARKAVQSKAVERTSFSLPIYFTPDVFISEQEDLPLADMMARTAVQEDTIKVDELEEHGDAESFAEDADGWPDNDDDYGSHTYEVESYGRQNSVTDFVQLAASTLRSTRSLTEQAQVTAIRKYEERQLIQGTDNDGDGFEGFRDIAPSDNVEDETGDEITRSRVRDVIRKLRRDGANRDNILMVTDHKTHQDLMEDTEDLTRYESPDDNLSFGFQTLDIDGVPVVESHGIPDEDEGREFWAFDASAHYMGMLQDVTMHPLARSSPEETFATDAYGTLVSEAPTRVRGLEGLA